MESKNTCVEVFGKRLKELRKANGYTIEQFAEAVGISKSTVGYYENNNRMPDIEILSRIADVLNVSADYLTGIPATHARYSFTACMDLFMISADTNGLAPSWIST